MANNIMGRIAKLVERNNALGKNHFLSVVIPTAEQFTDRDWATSLAMRELVDRAAAANRFRISLHAPDGATRSYYLAGSLESVTARARLFFPEPFILAVSPVGKAQALESIDRRVSLSL